MEPSGSSIMPAASFDGRGECAIGFTTSCTARRFSLRCCFPPAALSGCSPVYCGEKAVIKVDESMGSESTDSWARDPKTGRKMAPKQQPGYYPGYSTLSQKAYWDATTRHVIEDRVYNIPPVRFFTEEEFLTITAVCDRVLPQDHRTPDRKIPIVPF